MFALLLAGSLTFGLAGPQRKQRRRRPTRGAVAFALLFAVGCLRANSNTSPSEQSDALEQALLGGLTLVSFVASYYIHRIASMKEVRLAILVALTPIGVMLLLHSRELGDYNQRLSFRIGDFSYDSYQQISLIYGLLVLSALAEALSRDRPAYARLCLVAMSAIFAIGVAFGLGRGEAAALVVSVSILVSPRVALLAVPCGYWVAGPVVAALNTPLTQRLTELSTSLAQRGALANDAVHLAMDRPQLLFVGGGANYFQAALDLAPGLYPHNILLEGLITGGLPLLASMLLVFVAPVALLLRRGLSSGLSLEDRSGLALMIFVLLIHMKSGSLQSMWSLTLFGCVFAHCHAIARQSTTALPTKAAVIRATGGLATGSRGAS